MLHSQLNRQLRVHEWGDDKLETGKNYLSEVKRKNTFTWGVNYQLQLYFLLFYMCILISDEKIWYKVNILNLKSSSPHLKTIIDICGSVQSRNDNIRYWLQTALCNREVQNTLIKCKHKETEAVKRIQKESSIAHCRAQLQGQFWKKNCRKRKN